MILFIFILLVINTSTRGSSLIKSHGCYRNEDKLRVIGGVEVTPHSVPYQAELIISNKYFCGGVLISTEHILTAAHCVHGDVSVEVILGAHNINCLEDTQKVFHNVAVIIHEYYRETSWGYDIALLKLSKQVEISWAIKPIRNLADEEGGHFTGSTGLLTGWGYTSQSKAHIGPNLRQVYLDIISNEKCNSYFHARGMSIHESQLCTHGNDTIFGSVGACSGDSGGPLIVGNTLVGIVSSGFESCDGGFPTVYSRISSYRSWITKYSGI